MRNQGYIKLSRKFFENALWKEPRQYSRSEAWIDLIQMARFEDSNLILNNRVIEVRRGEIAASRRFFEIRWLWGSTKVSNFLDYLKKNGMINQRQTNGQTIITLCNYDIYNMEQTGDDDENKPPTNQRQTSDKPPTNQNKECKECKEGKECKDNINPHPLQGEEDSTDFMKNSESGNAKQTVLKNRTKPYPQFRGAPSPFVPDEFVSLWDSFKGKRKSLVDDYKDFCKKTDGLRVDYVKLRYEARFAKDCYFQTWLNRFFPKKSKRQLDLSFVDPAFRPVMSDWLAYKSERGQTYRQGGVEACYRRLLELSGHDADKARRVVEQSKANNWAGLFEIKTLTDNGNDRQRREGRRGSLKVMATRAEDYKTTF